MKKSFMKELIGYAGKRKILIPLSRIFSAMSGALAVVPFVFIWLIIKEVIELNGNYASANGIAFNGWMALLFAVLTIIFNFAALMCSHVSAFKVAETLRSKMMHHIEKVPSGILDLEGSGKLRRVINESSAITETYLAHNLPDLMATITTPIATVVTLFIFDWRLGLASLIPMFLAFIVMFLMMFKGMDEKMKQYQNALGEMSNEAVEYVRGIPVVKTFNQTIFSFKRFKKTIDDYEKWTISYTRQMRPGMILFTIIINSVFAFLISVVLLVNSMGKVDETFIINLIFYIIFTPLVAVSFNKLTYMGESKTQVKDGLNRIHKLLDLPTLSSSEVKEELHSNSIELKNVYFKYPQSDKYAIDDISLKIKPNEKIALVGPSGGGKTTLANLMNRFFDVKKGEILIGSKNIKDINKEILSKNIGFVFQDSKLIQDTILNNVKLANPKASMEEVNVALHKAQCDDIIEKLPDGVNTLIGSKGIYLSMGEMQRIAIARVFLKNPKIIILDEATAFADADNEYLVQKAFSELAKNKTVVMIAHRLTSIQGVDRILVVDNGKIIEEGSHKELLIKNGVYKTMWDEYTSSIKWNLKKEVE